MNFSVYIPNEIPSFVIPVNLAVKGFAQLDDKAYSIASGYYSQVRPLLVNVQPEVIEEGLLIVDWNKTVRRILDTCYELNTQPTPPTPVHISLIHVQYYQTMRHAIFHLYFEQLEYSVVSLSLLIKHTVRQQEKKAGFKAGLPYCIAFVLLR